MIRNSDFTMEVMPTANIVLLKLCPRPSLKDVVFDGATGHTRIASCYWSG